VYITQGLKSHWRQPLL